MLRRRWNCATVIIYALRQSTFATCATNSMRLGRSMCGSSSSTFIFVPIFVFSILMLWRVIFFRLGFMPWCDNLREYYPVSKGFLDGDIVTSYISNIEPINKLEYNHLHNPHDICLEKSLKLLNVVKSSLVNFELRKVIRRTWGQIARATGGKVIFLLGTSSETALQEKVKEESSMFGDILQGDFSDTYFNNILKTIMGIRWVSQFCPDSPYVFFLDDDVIVNYDNLLEFFGGIEEANRGNLFSGHVQTYYGPHREYYSKWHLPKSSYPLPCFPNFITGAAILTSNIVVRKLASAIPYVKIMKLDDVYLGIVAQITRISPVHNTDIDLSGSKIENLNCLIACHNDSFRNPEEYLKNYEYKFGNSACS